MRQAVTCILSLAVLTFTLSSSPGKDPPKAKDPPKVKEPDTTEPKDGKKRSYDLVSGRTLEEWVRLLKHPDPSIRHDAIRNVQFYGEDSSLAVTNLVHILSNDPDSTLRSNAAVVLMNVEVRDSQVPSVIEALSGQLDKNFQVNVRFHCAVALGRFENEAQKAVPILIKATTDPKSWEVREAACYSLARVYHDASKAPPDSRSYYALMAATRDEASKVRSEALQGLIMFGSPNNPKQRTDMDRALIGLINDREHFIVVWAYYGLMLNQGVNEKYLGALVNMLRSGDVPTKIQCLRALGMLINGARTDATRKKLPEIVAALQDPDASVVAMACDTLESINKRREISADVIAAIKAVADDKKREAPLRWYVGQIHTRLTKKPEVTKKPETIMLPEKREKP